METKIITPAGYTHRADLIGRGWTAALIREHLTDMVKVDAPEGVSNKAYADEEVAEVEASVAEVRKAVEALRDRVPATGGPYGEENTLARATLISRGWTSAHIDRLLGPADAHGGWGRHTTNRYGIDRVEWAEAHDAKLIKRLATVAKKREAEIAEKVEVEGEIVFRRIGGEWALQGMDLLEGEEVAVTKKDGSSTTAVVGEILTDDEGLRTAKIARKPRAKAPAPEPVVEEPVEEVPAPAYEPTAVTGHSVWVGQTLRWHGKLVTVTSVRSFFIDDDAPSIYGPHLYGYEDTHGAMWTYRDAAEEEAAPLLAREEENAENDRLEQIEGAAVRELIDHVRLSQTAPLERAEVEITGEVIYSDADVYGSGVSIYADAGTVTVLFHNTMDGDDWSRNNHPRGIALVAPRDEALTRALIDAVAARR